jgi:hypothetical protein
LILVARVFRRGVFSYFAEKPPRLTILTEQASIYAGKPENRNPHLLYR